MARGLGLHLIAGLAETCDASGAPSALPRNNALWVTPDGDVARYTKLHPFSFAGEHEKFGAGESVVTWTIEGVRVTPQVCYDLRFPEPFRLAADGTDLFAVVANWPERRRAHWQLLLKARAVENLCYVAGVNRVGDDGNGFHHAGDSAVISPWGETLASAAEIETVLLVDVDPAAGRRRAREVPGAEGPEAGTATAAERRPAARRAPGDAHRRRPFALSHLHHGAAPGGLPD